MTDRAGRPSIREGLASGVLMQDIELFEPLVLDLLGNEWQLLFDQLGQRDGRDRLVLDWGYPVARLAGAAGTGNRVLNALRFHWRFTAVRQVMRSGKTER